MVLGALRALLASQAGGLRAADHHLDDDGNPFEPVGEAEWNGWVTTFQGMAQQNIAALEARAANIQCTAAFSNAPAAAPPPAKQSFDQCFARCQQYTGRTKEQCFDACNR
jgi:hypothetical protein